VNKPVGSVNAAYDEGDGFWMATEEAPDRTHLVAAEPDPMLGAPEIRDVAPHREEEEIHLGESEWIGAVIAPIEGDNHTPRAIRLWCNTTYQPLQVRFFYHTHLSLLRST